MCPGLGEGLRRIGGPKPDSSAGLYDAPNSNAETYAEEIKIQANGGTSLSVELARYLFFD